MAHLLRGKQAGIPTDLSAGLAPDLFVLDHLNKFGINSQIAQLAYDPVQSLLAVGTNDTQFGPGQIHVFGQKRVQAVFPLPHRASIRTLLFCADRLLCLDSKNSLTVFSLETQKPISTYVPPAKITVLHCDPTLDYALLGTSSGDVLAYDMDRERAAPLRIPNLLKEQHPRLRFSPVVALAFHPRDIGTLLIGYGTGAVIYSFKQNKELKTFIYRIPRGAPGGDSDPSTINTERSPALTHATWHPTGTFILTGHEDGSIVIWDPKDGRIVIARTITDTHIDKPGPGHFSPGAAPGTFSLKQPLLRIAWCAKQDPDDTGILIAGGSDSAFATKSLSFMELGRTPVYATSSWQMLTDHFESPKRQRMLPTPPNTEVVDFCLIPRSSPHFSGAQDPIAILALLSSGEVITLSFPSGVPICPTNQHHVSMNLVHPFVNFSVIAPVERSKWLGFTEKRACGPPLFTGGAEAKRPIRRYGNRNIVQTSHADGTVRLWDAGHGDDIENDAALQVDICRAIGRQDEIDVSQISLAGAAGELSAGLKSGELVVFRWGYNKNAGVESSRGDNPMSSLINITDRTEPTLKEGFLPNTLLDEGNGPVTALKHSDVGFVAAGFEGGSLVVIDLRGPAIAYRGKMQDFIKADKRGSFRRTDKQTTVKPEWPTCIEFSVMSLEGDDYSSILLHVGTNLGHLATFKLLPGSNGPYSVNFVGVCSLDDRIIEIAPIRTETGQAAYASQSAVASLINGSKISGVLVAVSQSGVRIFKPATHKGAHKTWDEFLCDKATVLHHEDYGHALIGLYGDGKLRAYSLPTLKEIAAIKLDDILDRRRFADAMMTETGDVIGWSGPAELVFVNVLGTGLHKDQLADVLWNPERVVPPRPTISNLQWISGTQHVTPTDMDVLIGGPDRPPSARMLAQMKADERQRRLDERAAGGTTAGGSSTAPQDEGYWAYMQRQLNERTEKLGIMGDSMDELERNSKGWADDVGKFVNKQKRGMVLGAMKSKFGF